MFKCKPALTSFRPQVNKFCFKGLVTSFIDLFRSIARSIGQFFVNRLDIGSTTE